jgi:hypothetical protein
MSMLVLPIGERCCAAYFLPTSVANAVTRFHGPRKRPKPLTIALNCRTPHTEEGCYPIIERVALLCACSEPEPALLIQYEW